ncbi:UNVERIFIED_CONTAM: NADP-dependent 3-hydroxy acid dehydrogenase YdfG [Williamsia faeni]
MDLSAARHAFVTGGASGIGLGIADALARHGISVTIADINEESLDAVIGSRGSGYLGVALDVRDREAWKVAKARAETAFGSVDILVNNAGIGFNGCDVVDMDPATFDMLIAIDLIGVFNGVACFGSEMRARGGAHIVNTASVMGLISGTGGRSAYSAAKSAVVALSEGMRSEMEPHNVGVSVLCPGLVTSNLDQNTATLGGHVRENIQGKDIDHGRGTRAHGMDPATAGDQVARGIAHNLPYIITHPHYLGNIETRMDAIRASVEVTSSPS